jgi:hypothetical protein
MNGEAVKLQLKVLDSMMDSFWTNVNSITTIDYNYAYMYLLLRYVQVGQF